MLRFANSPDFEAAADEGANNTYEFTVNASDGTNSAMEENVTIEVTNLEEPGVVTLTTLQPQVGVNVIATLDDPDAGSTTISSTWMWLRGGSIIVGATSATYQPVVGDVGSVLTAKATYQGPRGRGYRQDRARPFFTLGAQGSYRRDQCPRVPQTRTPQLQRWKRGQTRMVAAEHAVRAEHRSAREGLRPR